MGQADKPPPDPRKGHCPLVSINLQTVSSLHVWQRVSGRNREEKMTTKPDTTLASAKSAARRLLNLLKSGDESATAIARTNGIDPASAKLADALHLIAKSEGHATWPDLKRAIEVREAAALGPEAIALKLLDNDWKEALSLAKKLPAEARRHPALALALNDAPVLTQLIEAGLKVSEKVPGMDLEPLLIVCQSRVPGQGATDCARILVEAGADLEAKWFHPGWPESPLGALYAASGLRRDPILTEFLLQAGIKTDDGESVYHSTEVSDTTCLRLLLKYGASTKKTNALNHQLDTERMEGLDLLLEAGADPDEPGMAPALHWAIKNGRSGRIIQRLLEAGADVSRDWHGATARSLAVLSGNREAAALIAERGGPISVAAAALEALRAGQKPEKLERSQLGRGEVECLAFAAANGRAETVKELVQLGWPLNDFFYHDGSPLHWSCWHGHLEAAKALIDAGADLHLKDPRFQATPLGWVCHGSVFAHPKKPDYPRIAEALLEAGGEPFEVTPQSFGRPDVLRVVKSAWRNRSKSD